MRESLILTFKEGTIKSIWEEVGLLYGLLKIPHQQALSSKQGEDDWIIEKSMFINDLEYKGHELSWVEYQRFQNDKV